MDWHQLKYFQALAAINNFTKAADKLNLSQPALSRSISRLEDEIGVPLFERRGRGVILNRYGDIFLRHVNKALEEIEEARQEIDKMVNPSHGTVFLAFIQTLGLSFIPDLIRSFLIHEPGVRFQLTQDYTENILSQVESAKVDLGFCVPKEPIENLSCFPIMEQELFLIIPKEHRLANRKQVDLCEVASDPFIVYKPEIALHDVIKRVCHETGFHPIAALEANDVRTVAGLVGAKLGVSLIPFTPGLDSQKVSLIPVRKPHCSMMIQMVWRRNGYMSPAVRHFKSYVESMRVKLNSKS